MKTMKLKKNKGSDYFSHFLVLETREEAILFKNYICLCGAPKNKNVDLGNTTSLLEYVEGVFLNEECSFPEEMSIHKCEIKFVQQFIELFGK